MSAPRTTSSARSSGRIPIRWSSAISSRSSDARRSISAGLDYPSIGPEHAYLQSIGRVEYHDCSDDLALEAFHKLSESEGIIPALESSHALGWLLRNDLGR